MATLKATSLKIGSDEIRLPSSRTIVDDLANATVASATTATKLKTARTIYVKGAVTGSASFDGSANVTIQTANGTITGSSSSSTVSSGSSSDGPPVLPSGYCDSAANSSSKLVSIEGLSSAQIEKGTMIKVRFNNGNTVANITMNVCNSGDKNVFVGLQNDVTKAIQSATKAYSFYNGGNTWYLLNPDSYPEADHALEADHATESTRASRVPRGNCNTPASEPAKTMDATGFKLEMGNLVRVFISYTNTALDATLNVSDTGAYPIYSADMIRIDGRDLAKGMYLMTITTEPNTSNTIFLALNVFMAPVVKQIISMPNTFDSAITGDGHAALCYITDAKAAAGGFKYLPEFAYNARRYTGTKYMYIYGIVDLGNAQLAIGRYGTAEAVYFFARIKNGSEWGPWYYEAGTMVTKSTSSTSETTAAT